MLPVLALLFIVLPVIELYLIVQVAHGIGVLDTVGLLLLISVVGAWVVRRAGVGVFTRVQADLNAGRVPTGSLVDGLLVLLAGVLLVAPGFLTDLFAVFLLLPPTRALVRRLVLRRLGRRVQAGVTTRTSRFGRVTSEVIVVDDEHIGERHRPAAPGHDDPRDPPSLPPI